MMNDSPINFLLFAFCLRNSLSMQAKLREVASLEGHVLLKKLRDALEFLKGRLAGRNKEDVEKAISMVNHVFSLTVHGFLSKIGCINIS